MMSRLLKATAMAAVLAMPALANDGFGGLTTGGLASLARDQPLDLVFVGNLAIVLCTLLALNFLTAARIHRQRGEQEAAQAALTSAAALGQRVTSESLLIAQDVRVQVLLALGRQEEARPLVEHLVALG